MEAKLGANLEMQLLWFQMDGHWAKCFQTARVQRSPGIEDLDGVAVMI